MTDEAAREPPAGVATTLVFDVTETLLDLSPLSPFFARVFGDASARSAWFDQTVLYCEALSLAGRYETAGVIGVAVLKMMARVRGRPLAKTDIGELKRLAAATPAYADTPAALESLKAAGFRLVTLSNSPSAGVDAQLAAAGIKTYFDQTFSIDDAVRRFKPARESYISTAQALGLKPSQLWLVSCHAFDTLGAAAAGYRTAMITRPGNAPIELSPPPEIVADDLRTLARELIRLKNGG